MVNKKQNHWMIVKITRYENIRKNARGKLLKQLETIHDNFNYVAMSISPQNIN